MGSRPDVSGLRRQDTFYGLLASLRGQLFRDADFAEFYCLDNGRTSVPPSLLATALLLQTYAKVSDAEAKARGDFDIRWKVALGKVALGKVALGKVALGKVALGKVALGKVAWGRWPGEGGPGEGGPGEGGPGEGGPGD